MRARVWLGGMGCVASLLGILLWSSNVPAEQTAPGSAGAPAAKGEGTPSATPDSEALAREVQEKILGRWQMVGQGDVLEFSAEGTFRGVSEHAEMTGRYRITRQGELSIAWGLPLYRGKRTPETKQAATPGATPQGKPLVEFRRKVRFEQNELILEDPDTGDSFRYRRLQ